MKLNGIFDDMNYLDNSGFFDQLKIERLQRRVLNSTHENVFHLLDAVNQEDGLNVSVQFFNSRQGVISFSVCHKKNFGQAEFDSLAQCLKELEDIRQLHFRGGY